MLPGGVLPEDVKSPCGEPGGFAGGAAGVPVFVPAEGWKLFTMQGDCGSMNTIIIYGYRGHSHEQKADTADEYAFAAPAA